MSTIRNASAVPLNLQSGSLPDVSGAMQDYFQPMVFEKLTKTLEGFQVVETGAKINFRGLIQPYTERQLFLKSEGQRAWTWFTLYAEPVLTLQVDDVVQWNGVQTRVMSRKDYALYGFVEYHCVQDWLGSGP